MTSNNRAAPQFSLNRGATSTKLRDVSAKHADAGQHDQRHQLPPACLLPSAPGKHLSAGEELSQAQGLQGFLELGSRLDFFFQKSQREKFSMQHLRVFPTETTA